MIENNKELRRSVIGFGVISAVLVTAGFLTSVPAGLLALLGCAAFTALHLCTEVSRYRQLAKISQDLDGLLTNGKTLSIRDYDEGELSILANQIQKMALRLTESAEASKADKLYLADSLANISHQLRTPLTAMNLTVTMLREEDLTEEKRMELTGELRKLLTRVDWLVETLLKLSKLDAGTVRLAREVVPVRELIVRATAPLEIPMDLRNQKLVVDCREEMFLGDMTWSAEALGNILKNCMEHTPEGGTITVHAQETALYTQIEVTDTGAGFAPQDLPHLFERFYKGSGSSGYGIGLALARTIITSQNGSVTAANHETGARFTMKFYKQVI